MKKTLSIILVFSLIFTFQVSSFADNNLAPIDQLISEIDNNLVINNNGVVDIDLTLSKINLNQYSDVDINNVQLRMKEINKFISDEGYYMSDNFLIKSKKLDLPENNSIGVMSLPEGHEYIEVGSYYAENNYIRTYFDSTATEKMLNNREKFGDVAFVAGLFGSLSVPYSFLLTIAGYVTSEQYNAIKDAYYQSGEYGVCHYYWRYNTHTEGWSPWYEGSIVGPNWTKRF